MHYQKNIKIFYILLIPKSKQMSSKTINLLNRLEIHLTLCLSNFLYLSIKKTNSTIIVYSFNFFWVRRY